MEDYGLLPIIPGYVWSALLLLLTLVRNKAQDRRGKYQDEQLEAGSEEEMKVQVSLEN